MKGFWRGVIGAVAAWSAMTMLVQAADFYVSPTGSDAWSGTLDRANAQRTDGPFATVQRARDAVREGNAHRGPRDVVVQIRGGIIA